MRISCVVVIALAVACSKKDTSKEQAAPAQTPATAAGDAAAAPPVADAASANPGLPSLGEPPKGMNVAKAKACDAGDAAACVAAAQEFSPKGAYRSTKSGLSQEEADRLEAGTAKYGERGCELKNAEGCYLWAKFGPWKNRDIGMSRACELGHSLACADYGSSLLGDGHSDEELMKGRELLEKACRDKVTEENRPPGEACDRAAEEWGSKRGKIKKDAKKAAELRKLACEQGWMIKCPCKQDEDCGQMEDVELYCFENKCAAASTD